MKINAIRIVVTVNDPPILGMKSVSVLVGVVRRQIEEIALSMNAATARAVWEPVVRHHLLAMKGMRLAECDKDGPLPWRGRTMDTGLTRCASVRRHSGVHLFREEPA